MAVRNNLQLPNEKFLTVPKARKKYFYTSRTLIRWVKRGRVLGVKHANKWYIGEKSLKLYLKNALYLS